MAARPPHSRHNPSSPAQGGQCRSVLFQRRRLLSVRRWRQVGGIQQHLVNHQFTARIIPRQLEPHPPARLQPMPNLPFHCGASPKTPTSAPAESPAREIAYRYVFSTPSTNADCGHIYGLARACFQAPTILELSLTWWRSPQRDIFTPTPRLRSSVASNLAPDRPQILVKPVEALANRVWTRKGAVPALVDHVLFVGAWRAQEVEKRTL